MTPVYCTPEEAVSIVESGERVFIHSSGAAPILLVNALLDRAGQIYDVELTSMSTFGKINWKRPEVLESFYLNSLFVSENVREWANSDQGAFVPIFLSEIPQLFDQKILPIDVALVQVSPPDKHGYCSLGISVDASISAVRNARKVIAQVNPKMPRVLGDGMVHFSVFTKMVWHDSPIFEVDYATKTNPQTDKIGQFVAGIIEDGSTIQMGVGGVPDAVLKCLTNHKGLGVHTEMFSDGILPLVDSGVITNEHKKIQRGKIVTAFVLGTRKIYDFVDNNPDVNCREISFVNDTAIIRQNPKVVAINSAIEVDLTGQVCSDSIGPYQFSGIGGQMDFIRGACLSLGGQPIIALPSVTNKGVSRIVPFLKPGAGVVTTRGHIHWVATEYGIVNLYGKNLKQRAKLLISIAHPDHQEALDQAYFERFHRHSVNLKTMV